MSDHNALTELKPIKDPPPFTPVDRRSLGQQRRRYATQAARWKQAKDFTIAANKVIRANFAAVVAEITKDAGAAAAKEILKAMREDRERALSKLLKLGDSHSPGRILKAYTAMLVAELPALKAIGDSVLSVPRRDRESWRIYVQFISAMRHLMAETRANIRDMEALKLRRPARGPKLPPNAKALFEALDAPAA